MKNVKKIIIIFVIAAIVLTIGAYIIANYTDLFDSISQWVHDQLGGTGDAYQLPTSSGPAGPAGP